MLCYYQGIHLLLKLFSVLRRNTCVKIVHIPMYMAVFFFFPLSSTYVVENGLRVDLAIPCTIIPKTRKNNSNGMLIVNTILNGHTLQ